MGKWLPMEGELRAKHRRAEWGAPSARAGAGQEVALTTE